MIIKKTTILFLLLSWNLEALELYRSVPFDYGKSIKTESEKLASGVVYNAISNQPVNDEHSILATTNMGVGNEWISLFDDNSLHRVNVETKQYLGNWPLTSWSQTIQMKGEGSNWQTRHLVANALTGNTAEVKDPETMTLATYQYDLPSFKTFMGCLADSPLRYGDIDQNSEKELVLLLDNDLVVFSSSQQKMIFATRFAISDELAPEDVAGWFDGGLELPSSQYVASSGFGDGLRAAFPATRSFAKIFVDDFDGNGKPDIVVWRKLYQSREVSDAVKGFKFETELLAHYQLENGEYQIQFSNPPEDGEFETDPAQQTQIKGWLETKNLTWQKGFPTKSECAGQEGQLIPEMHDVLLNDGDVLQ